MKHKRLKIFGAILIVILLGVAGWYGWQQSQDSDKTSTNTSAKGTVATGQNTHITFSKDATLTDQVKSEILQKIVNPMVIYHTTVARQPIENIKISATTPMSVNDYRFKLEYDGGSGFVLGANQKIGYWLPALCDDSGKCDDYPEQYKKMLPETYKAYQACESANKSGDKDAANSACVL
jgi:hypothetical protein